MAKYTTTSMEFFLKLSWKEGMAYFAEVAQMANEEREHIESSARPSPSMPDTTGWPTKLG